MDGRSPAKPPGRGRAGTRGCFRETRSADDHQELIDSLSSVSMRRGRLSPGGSRTIDDDETILKVEENGGPNLQGQRGSARPSESQGDFIITRPDGMESKKGSSGQQIVLTANYYLVTRGSDLSGLFKYRIDFDPHDDNTRLKKALVRTHNQEIGSNVCDGHLLYVSRPLAPEKTQFEATSRQNKTFKISLRLVEEVKPTDPMYVVFYNTLIKKCQQMLQLDEMNRNYFDRHHAVKYPNHKLELWPGYITVMRQHEDQILLCVEVTHKVLRQDSVLAMMTAIRSNYFGRPQEEMQAAVERELIGKIIMTEYNRKTYRIDEIKWALRPTHTFQQKGVDVTYVDYYQTKHERQISAMGQPLLASNPKARDIRRGQTTQFILVPEFCRMTGLTDELRRDFRLMKDLGEHLFMVPETRLKAINGLMNRIQGDDATRSELNTWDIKLGQQPIQVQGRVMPSEKINLGGKGLQIPDQKGDWTTAFRNHPMLSCAQMKNWVVLVPVRDAGGVDNLYNLLNRVSRPLGFTIPPPKEIVRLQGISPQAYVKAIDEAVRKYQGQISMFFIILANNKLDTYSAVKKLTLISYGIPSQCFLAKHFRNQKGLMTVCTKVAVQMNAKLGGEAWSVEIPLKGMMIVGFDVYHGATDRKGQSVGAMVSSLNKNCTKYFSTTSFHGNNEELSMNVCANLTKCLTAYQHENGQFPDRILFYRDGVGEGQLQFVYATELEELKKAIRGQYEAAGQKLPTFTFIVVTKKLNTRIMHAGGQGPQNPPPGTVVDDVITLPERYDFFIVAQSVRQGTVSPTSYHVLSDDSNLDPDKIQRITFKLCHLYFNWSGTVSVPSPVQYAHKLAFLTGTALGAPVDSKLSHLLYFL